MTLHQAKLATYALGRRAPDKAPRIVGPRRPKAGNACPACGQPVANPNTGVAMHADPDARKLAEPLSRGEALRIIETHG